jgi:hypothetical protein
MPSGTDDPTYDVAFFVKGPGTKSGGAPVDADENRTIFHVAAPRHSL